MKPKEAPDALTEELEEQAASATESTGLVPALVSVPEDDSRRALYGVHRAASPEGPRDAE